MAIPMAAIRWLVQLRLATIELIENEYMQNAADMGEYVMDILEEIMARHPSIGCVRGKGLMIGVEFVKDRGTKDPDAKTA